MGQKLSCREKSYDHESSMLFTAAQNGELNVIESMLEDDHAVLYVSYGPAKLSALHVAAAHGQIEVLSMILDRGCNPDVLNRHKQTPLMLAAMHGSLSCVKKLIEAGANMLMFDSAHRRTCLHYAAYYGHSDCLQAILSAAQSSPITESWGFARFVNIRDGSGSTPLHLAARQGRAECLHVLLDNGALVSASTGGYRYPGSTALHFAAHSGSVECIRELLAWGGNRLQLDSSGSIPYSVALKYKHKACAALLNPLSAEPLVWPSPLKFISELNPEAKALLEQALMEANREIEKAILNETDNSLASLHSDVQDGGKASEASEAEMCCICFDQVCTIEVRQCGHQMCAHCILALCCHKKPIPTSTHSTAPVCPFCRSSITELVVAPNKTKNDCDPESGSIKLRSMKSISCSEGGGSSGSFKTLSAMASFGILGGRNSGKIAAEGVVKLE